VADEFADPFVARFPSVIANPRLMGSLSAEGGKQSDFLHFTSCHPEPACAELAEAKGLSFPASESCINFYKFKTIIII
jgi:hypothetical protein